MSWLSGRPLAVIDTETTGLDPLTSHVVEVAVIHLDLGGEPTVAWSSRIRPPVPIPAEATAIHGLSDADVAGAPTWQEAHGALALALGDRTLAAWNAPFDYGMVRAEHERHGLPCPTWPWLDPMVWSRAVDRYRKGGHNLAAVARRQGIAYPAHGAVADAMVTALLLAPLLRRAWALPGCRWESPGALWAWQDQAARTQEVDLVGYLAKQGRALDRAPWHDLAGLPGPAAPPPPTTPCSVCRSPILWSVSAEGGRTALNPDGTEHHHEAR